MGGRCFGVARASPSRLLGLSRHVDGADKFVPAVALGQEPVLAPGGHLAQLTSARRPDASRRGDGHPLKTGRQSFEILNQPGIGQQDGEQSCRGTVCRTDVSHQRLSAGSGSSVAI